MSQEVAQKGILQGSEETLTYTIKTTNWASSPTLSPSQAGAVKAYTLPGLEDVTSVVFPSNLPTVSGDVITLSPLTGLVVGNTYRIEVKFTAGNNTWECYFKVKCKV